MSRHKGFAHHGSQAFRFLVVGGANFVVTLAVFYGMLQYTGSHYLLSLVCAWATGMVFSYVLNFTWVFRPQERLAFKRRFAQYCAAGGASLLLNMLALHLLVRMTQHDPFLLQFWLIPLVVLFNYATAKFWSLRTVD